MNAGLVCILECVKLDSWLLELVHVQVLKFFAIAFYGHGRLGKSPHM